MSEVIDIGIQSRERVRAPLRLLLEAISGRRSLDSAKISVLTDARVVGGLYEDFDGSIDELLPKFASAEILGFRIIVSRGNFVTVWSPNCFDSALKTWRIIGEGEATWNEALLDEIIDFPDVEYAIISQDETLDLEQFDHVRRSNLPWDHWRLIAARVSSEA
jgi:hypothetical protein